MVTINVGPAKNVRSFLVHKVFLKARSGFFSRALSENWLEPGENVNLTEDDPQAFALYLNHI